MSLLPIPEILQGKLDGNNAEQFRALRRWEAAVRLHERGGIGPEPEARPFVVEVPLGGTRYYRVMAIDADEAEALVADYEGELLYDDLEEMRDFGQATDRDALP
jgi:hypothetical protein